jgi:hypothetical protein
MSGNRNSNTPPQHRKRLALAFAGIVPAFLAPSIEGEHTESPFHLDMANSQRIELLLTWSGETDDRRFADAALALAQKPVGGFSAWRALRRGP